MSQINPIAYDFDKNPVVSRRPILPFFFTLSLKRENKKAHTIARK
ncbi:hypothetical protein CHCC15091_2837 [Bacillus licheniformis]|nr:hypothetical protein CHCC15091_2837 [Bacillus licheniformis]